jgi:hypothetical protein
VTVHPKRRSWRFTLLSRNVLDSNLFNQNVALLDGVVENLHRAWRCQKQPCTNTAVLYFASTMSGRPGNFACSLNRSPARCNALRTYSSGLVSFPRIPDIIRLRVFRFTTSIGLSRKYSLPSRAMAAQKKRRRLFRLPEGIFALPSLDRSI